MTAAPDRPEDATQQDGGAERRIWRPGFADWFAWIANALLGVPTVAPREGELPPDPAAKSGDDEPPERAR